MECRAEHDNTNDGWLGVLIMLSSAKRNWKTCVVKNVSNIKPCHLSRSLLKSKASSCDKGHREAKMEDTSGDEHEEHQTWKQL